MFTFFLFLNSPEHAGAATWFPSAPNGTAEEDEWSQLDWAKEKQLAALQTYYRVFQDRGLPPPHKNFKNVGLRFQPSRGAALLWPNVDLANVHNRNPLTAHAAEVVERRGAEKWAANAWLHLRDFRTPHAKGLTG